MFRLKSRAKLVVIGSVFIVFFHSSSNAQYVTIASGNWTNPAIWNIGVPPTWGNYTVTVNHAVTLNTSLNGANWNLLVNNGASLTQSGCRNIATYGISVWTNYGTISCAEIGGTATIINYGTLDAARIATWGSPARWLNKPTGTITCNKANFAGTSDLINEGSFTAYGTGHPCYTITTGTDLNFNADTILNTGTITLGSGGAQIGAEYFINSGTALLNSAGFLNISNLSIFKNEGTITSSSNLQISSSPTINDGSIVLGGTFFLSNASVQNNGSIAESGGLWEISSASLNNSATGIIQSSGLFKISSNTTVVNYGEIIAYNSELDGGSFSNYHSFNLTENFINNAGTNFYNYGCDCYSPYDGTVQIGGDFYNHGLMNNNGIVNVYGNLVYNYHELGSSDCGKFNMASATMESYGGDLIFGRPVICVANNICWGCIIDPMVWWTCSIGLTDCENILPIEFGQLSAEPNEMYNELIIRWNTLSEINNDYFTLEKSTDGVHWTILKTISGSGTTQKEVNYSVIDNLVELDQVTYYRLFQTDYDGRISFLGITSNLIDETRLNITPNPASEEIKIGGLEKGSLISIYTLTGHLLLTKSCLNDTSIHIVVKDLPAGTYFIRAGNKTISFVKY